MIGLLRREPWSFWCILKCSVNWPMRSLSSAICTSVKDSRCNGLHACDSGQLRIAFALWLARKLDVLLSLIVCLCDAVENITGLG